MKLSRYQFTLWSLSGLIAVSAIGFAAFRDVRMSALLPILMGVIIGTGLGICIGKLIGSFGRMIRPRPYQVDEELGPIVWRRFEDHDHRHPQAGVRQP